MVKSRNIILFNIRMGTMNWNTESGIDRSIALSLGNMRSLNCFVLGDQRVVAG